MKAHLIILNLRGADNFVPSVALGERTSALGDADGIPCSGGIVEFGQYVFATQSKNTLGWSYRAYGTH